MLHKSTFHLDDGDILLFKGWVLSGPKETYLSCILLTILGVVYHGIRFVRQQYGRRCHNLQCQRYILNKGHILQTLMHVLQFVWGYFLMLAVMTYNLWVMVAVLAGFALGYFLFGWGEFEDRHQPKIGMHHHTCRRGVGMTQQLLSSGNTVNDTLTEDAASSSVRCVCSESETRL